MFGHVGLHCLDWALSDLQKPRSCFLVLSLSFVCPCGASCNYSSGFKALLIYLILAYPKRKNNVSWDGFAPLKGLGCGLVFSFFSLK